MDDYIDPKTATKVRVHSDGDEGWLIDAADDDGNYTEVCWDSRWVTDEHGDKTWELIPSKEVALTLVPLFVEENVPHLAGTDPEIIH